MEQDFPILEFDPSPAVIEPSRTIAARDVPERCVVCFFSEVIQGLVESGQAHVVATARSEVGEHPLYELAVVGQRLAVFHPGVGAPLAAGLLEEMIAFGCRKFIACGGAGVLDREIASGHIVVPLTAVRDEGTSYHYLPPSREVNAGADGVAAIEKVLGERKIPYLLGKTWTTDAFYRETPGRVQRRRAEGCVTVEMEAAAFFAVAAFRGVSFAQMLYGGDDVSGADWDPRDWHLRGSNREKLFWLAAYACLAIA